MLPGGLATAVLMLLLVLAVHRLHGEHDRRPARFIDQKPLVMTVISFDGQRRDIDNTKDFQAAVPFPIVLPRSVPDGYVLEYAHASDESLGSGVRTSSVLLGFNARADNGRRLALVESGSPLSSRSSIKPATVNGRPAQLEPSVSPSNGNTVTWSLCDRGFALSATHLKDDELLRVAESIASPC